MTKKCDIIISEALQTKHGIPARPTIKVRVSNRIVEARLRIKSDKTGYTLSSALLSELRLRSSSGLRFRYDPVDQLIHLGPIVGVMASALPNRANREELEPTSLQAELTYISSVGRHLRGMVYVFLPSSINWSQQRVRGYNYRYLTPERGVWESALYPLPDVVYNRISSRRAEMRAPVKEALRRLSELPYTKCFNPSYLNKWEVHQILSSHPLSVPYLPETMRLSAENLQTMLLRHPVLYLKPSNGSLGHGIIKVRRSSGNEIKFTVYSRGRVHGAAENAEDLIRKTNRYRKGKPYIVQQGLELARYRNSVFDLRIIYQKNGLGEWQIGKKFVRVAPGLSSIANLARGGRAERSQKVFKYLYNRKSLIEEKNGQIKQLCQSVATVIDNGGNVHYGELGLDIGMDKAGKPWLIEVNSKPRKTTETETSVAIMRNAYKRPLDYASYLAGFPVRHK